MLNYRVVSLQKKKEEKQNLSQKIFITTVHTEVTLQIYVKALRDAIILQFIIMGCSRYYYFTYIAIFIL